MNRYLSLHTFSNQTKPHAYRLSKCHDVFQNIFLLVFWKKKKYRSGTKWKWVNNGRICVWTLPLSKVNKLKVLTLFFFECVIFQVSPSYSCRKKIPSSHKWYLGNGILALSISFLGIVLYLLFLQQLYWDQFIVYCFHLWFFCLWEHPDHTAKSRKRVPVSTATSHESDTNHRPPSSPRLHPSHPPISRLHPKPGIPSVQLCTSSPFCPSIQKSIQWGDRGSQNSSSCVHTHPSQLCMWKLI